MSKYYNQFICNECESYSVILEDNGRVGYAYLIKDNKIVGDVWVYNQEIAPFENPWNDKSQMPFLNPMAYVKDTNIEPIQNSNEILLDWKVIEMELDNLDIYLRGSLIARLRPGAKPGWAALAKKDGPLAKALSA